MNCVTSKEFYIQSAGEDLPIFYKPFFLDAITEGNWEVTCVCEGESILACMPYSLQRKKYTVIRQPPFAIYQGPFFFKSEGQKLSLTKEMEVLSALESSVAPFDYYNQNWHPSSRNWLPFHWKGYLQSTRYSYVIHNNEQKASLRERYSENVRRNVRRASAKLMVSESTDIDALFSVIEKTFTRKNLSQPYDLRIFRRVVLACLSEKCCSILLARDADSNLHAGMFLVWDSQWVYYIAGGIDEKFRNSGAMTLLFDKAIQFAMDTRRSFDFEGSMIESVEAFFRSFGAVQQEYFVLTKVNSLGLRVRFALGKIHPRFNQF